MAGSEVTYVCICVRMSGVLDCSMLVALFYEQNGCDNQHSRGGGVVVGSGAGARSSRQLTL